MKVLFMGTPDFAVETLRALADNRHEILGVVTRIDKPRGRGNIMTPCPVKTAALEMGFPILQPTTLRGEEFAKYLDSLAPEVIVVVAFGMILPENVLKYPKYGCINVHASLLPKYRGAAPMQRAIEAGESEIGVTTMQMAAGIDTGDMLLRESINVTVEDDFGSVHDKLAKLGAELLIKTLAEIESITPEKQDDSLASYAAKIEKSELGIDFSSSAADIVNKIRATSPFPLSFTRTPEGKLLKILRAKTSPSAGAGKYGEVVSLSDKGEGVIRVFCGEGCLDITVLVPEGKSKMTAADFIRGRRIAVGDLLQTEE